MNDIAAVAGQLARLRESLQQKQLELDGIGAQLKGEDGYTTIVELTPGGAAGPARRSRSRTPLQGASTVSTRAS